ATTLLERDDLSDRIERGQVKGIVTDAQLAGRFAGLPGAPVRIAVGAGAPGWADYDRSYEAGDRFDTARTRADELLLLYLTSGTTARPKLVAHTQASYPIGHLSTMYWLGLKPGDVHLNLSSPGWAKHAWSSLFAPWNAAATLREAASAGEPLNPEVIARVREAWGITIRDGYGQTETTAQIGSSPGQPVK